jgi:hypothetical protein
MAVSLLKCCVSGALLVNDLGMRIISTMSSLDFIARTYPMLTNWGVRDEDVLVHSLGCSAWNTLGQELGFMAVSECPAPATYGADIRSDSTWFSLDHRRPTVLIEFERFESGVKGQQKLNDKIRNLLESAVRWGNRPSILILSIWSKGIISAPDKQALVDLGKNGFKSVAGIHVMPTTNTTLIFNRFFFETTNTGELLLTQTRTERLM